MSFISEQASYGQPADYVLRNQELEGANLAYKDLLPKKAHLFADQIGRISGEYLTPDRPFYDQFKNQLQEKTKEFQKRLDSGENIGTITNEMSNFRNQISGTLDAFKKRKDMFEAWNSSLEKNDKIDSNTKTALRNLALDNISNITSKKGLTLDLPLPSPAVPVNYDTKGAEIVDKLVEKEGHETYGSKWYEIAADPTKFANFKSGVIQRDPAKIKAAVLSGLANDPEVQSSLDQDAELHLHNIYKNSEDPNDKFHIQQNAGQLHEQIKQAKLNDVSDLLSWTKQGLNKSLDRTIIDNTERQAAAKREKIDFLTTSTSSEGLNQNTQYNPKVDDVAFDKDGNIIPPKVSGARPVSGSPLLMGTDRGQKLENKTDDIKLKEQEQLVASLKDKYGLEGTPKEVISAYKGAFQAIKNESIPLESISNVAAKNIGEALIRNNQQRGFYIKDSKGETTTGTKDEVIKELGIKEEDFDKQLTKGISGFTQSGPTPGSYYAEIKNDDGETRRVMISADNEFQRMFKTSYEIDKARKTLEPQVVTPFEEQPNFHILVKPNISKKGKPSWEYIKMKTDDKGNVVEQEPTSLEEIRQEEKDFLKKSNYLGSLVTVTKPNTTE